MDIARFLTEPLGATYVQQALIEIILLSVAVGIVGSYVVLRGLSFFSLALSHGVFPGVVAAYIIGWNYLIVTMIVGVGISLIIGLINRHERVGNAAAVGAIYTGSFALGIVLISLAGLKQQLSEFLFGRLFGVGWDDIAVTAGVVGLVLIGFALARKEILLAAFDPNMTRAQGLPLRLLESGFLALMALVVVAALPAVGNIQIIALLVTPPATARLLTNRLPIMMLVAGLISLIGGVVGVYIAYHANYVPGATVVVTLTVMFLLVLLGSPRHNPLLSHFRRPYANQVAELPNDKTQP